MIPVGQRLPHEEDENGKTLVVGDCFSAALASILELDYELVPHFVRDHQDEPPGAWDEAFTDWALALGWYVLHYGLDDAAFEAGEWVPPGYWLATVESPRGPGLHAVVMRGKDLVWDPHPGLHKGEHRGFLACRLFVPLDPARPGQT